ncbi:MAG: DUF479 domain-containing protein [Saprospiraceae bacterium]|nr:DUF479 domain-containing protein [Saprospiraceae bacterium]MCB9318922.1 DUF479 domain-containing protein [Lewinellaceae bacterium]
MNYLAHLLLSREYPEEMVGNFLTDMLTWQEQQALAGGYMDGMMMHRQIDAYTDRHEAVRECIRLIRGTQGKYAPVVVDILFDYLIARHWFTYYKEPLELFVLEVYGILSTHRTAMSERIWYRVERMIHANWLVQYTTKEGLEFVFERLQSRTRFENNLQLAVRDFMDQYDLFEARFNQFFPDLLAQIPVWRESFAVE